ncbi:DedA family protein [Alicyclobacillaceae bacterium I2511]|nr:DedA family protein [Alicyclobacillaceae bacterium I2511]
MHIDIQLWIQHFGYLGVFFIIFMEMVGIPFPAETTLTLSGIAWTRGLFTLVPLLLTASLANILGSTVAYEIGYFLGRPVILRFGRYVGITEARLNAADRQFSRFRTPVVFFGKFIAGIRIIIPYLAGINRMSFWIFSLYNAIATVAWATLFILLGSTLDVLWIRYHVLIRHDLGVSISVLLLLVAAIVWWKVRSHHKKKQREREYAASQAHQEHSSL